jgi:hypothetical protein
MRVMVKKSVVGLPWGIYTLDGQDTSKKILHLKSLRSRRTHSITAEYFEQLLKLEKIDMTAKESES